ncbi:MAG: multidrug ABC transporter substrate-binding protein [Acidobacteria bacterium SCN 69-37]|nr:MAG: multidrug ABC transporter substrate-binding protein [Acidobacteria bacterium SCN 69-37]
MRRPTLDIGPELAQGVDNLRAHKLRSILTMLGMIFGVAAVIAMLSIGAGAQQQVIAFIEQLGVRNVIVEARESGDNQALQRVRQLSAGLSFADLRTIEATVDGLAAASPRKRLIPSKTLPRAQGDIPAVFGVSAVFQEIGGLTMARGRFFTADEEAAGAAVTVLGQSAATAFFGADDPVGQFVKFNDEWFRVVGVAAPRLAVQGDVGGLPAQDSNNVAYVPISSAIRRLEDAQAYLRDEIDAIYLRLASDDRVAGAGTVVRGLLDATHRSAGDFTVIVPAELLAQQQQTRRLFQFVMVAIASISLLVGGIGIMNIMLASVMERTREIGVRRAVGATRRDVIRQFLVETTIITITGGLAGTVVGIVLSQLVAYLAGWSTVVTVTSVVVACVVSVSVGIVFGLYPAARAARLDPVSALHYE